MHREPTDSHVPFTAARTSLLACALVLSIGFSSCKRTSTPLAGSAASAPALAQRVLAALERRDVTALREVVLSEQEFREQVWPELPAARPERKLPFSYVWGELRQKSEAALAATLTAQGGQRYELVAVRFLGDTTHFQTYLVHRKTELIVQDATGTEMQLRLFGSVLEKDGRFKVFSYVLD